MNLKSILIAAILYSFIGITHATDWRIISASEDAITFMDVSSIKKDDEGHMKSWSQSFSKDGTYYKALALYDCSDETIGMKAIFSYKRSGELESSKSNEYVSFNPVPPETIGSFILKVVCSDAPEAELQLPYQGKLKEDLTPEAIAKEVFKKAKPKGKSK